MNHLSPDRLLDVIEGARLESSEPHLQSCPVCRRQIDDLRAAMSLAAGVNVPEPSPLFWNHFSARVRDAVDADGGPRPAGWMRWLALAGGVVAAVVVAVGLTLYRPAAPSATPDARAMATAEPAAPYAVGDDDAALAAVSDLARDVDLESAHEAGLAAFNNDVDALGVLSEGERVELQRLLKEELAKS